MQRTRVIVTVLDDLDLRGGLETQAEHHHVLMLDGTKVALDLSEAHHKELTGFLTAYLDAGEVLARPTPPKPPKNNELAVNRRDYKEAARWAQRLGRPVPKTRQTKGFQQLVEDYREARSKGDTP